MWAAIGPPMWVVVATGACPTTTGECPMTAGAVRIGAGAKNGAGSGAGARRGAWSAGPTNGAWRKGAAGANKWLAEATLQTAAKKMSATE